MKRKYLCSGNEACAEGAIAGGCRFYAGYPITPQNELTAYMSRRMEQAEGVFIQAESELAAINMVYGASAAGARAMTSSSSPGISLKQEGISYLAGSELPAVIINVMRGGPGLGNISPAQGDYFQATKGGGHGDYRLLVLAPANVQEMFDFTREAFTLSDKYRNPVMILADGLIGQMMEPLSVEEGNGPCGTQKKEWALTGAKGRSAQCIKSLYLGDGVLEAHNMKLQEKYRKMSRETLRYVSEVSADTEFVLVAYGSMSRMVAGAVERLAKEGVKAALFRPVTLWPFPYESLRALADEGKRFLVVEMSAGQMVEDVRLAVQDDDRVKLHGRMGGGIPSEEEIKKTVLEWRRSNG